MTPLHIAPRVDRADRKSRVFSATILAHATVDDGDNLRPAYVAFAGEDTELRPFVANLRDGRQATDGSRLRVELLKTARYEWAWARYPEGAVATAFLPDFCRADPGMVDPELVEFLCLPGRRWADRQAFRDRARVAEYGEALVRERRDARELFPDAEPDGVRAAVDRLVPHAHLFCVYLDRRTRAPLPADGRFFVQVFLASLRLGLAHRLGRGYRGPRAEGLEDAGIAPEGAVLFRASQEAAEGMLADEVREFFGRTG